MLPIQEAQSTEEARNSSSQVSMNDVTGTEEGSLPSLVVYDTDSGSHCLWMNSCPGLNDTCTDSEQGPAVGGLAAGWGGVASIMGPA